MNIPASPIASRSRRAVFTLASAFVALAAFATPSARAATWLDETFEAYATGVAPDTTTSPQLMSAGPALVIDGNGGKMIRYAKPAGTGSVLQYALSAANATPRPRGFLSFKILRNPDATIPVGHIFSFRLGPNDTTTNLGAEGNALISIRFYQTSSTTNLRVYSTNGASPTPAATQVGASTTYNPTGTLQTVRIWYNDDETTPLAYVDPAGANQSLNPNSFVIYLGNTLVTPSASGSPFNSPAGTNLNIGKIAFVTSSTNASDMSLDDIYAADEAPSAPAPAIVSATAATAYLGVPFSFQLVADGATSYTAAPLPDGLSLNSATGVISGTATTIGVTEVAVSATNAYALTGNGALSITVEQPTANVFTGANPSLNNTASWSLGEAPNSTTNTAGSYRDLLLDSTATALTTSSNNIYAKSWNATNGLAYTVSGTSATQTSFRAGTNGATDTPPFTNLVSGQANDLVYLSGNSSLTFLPDNPTGGSLPSVFLLRNPGNLRINAGSTLDLGAAITSSTSLNTLTKLGQGTAIFRAAGSYTGSTTLAEGVLRIENAAALGTGALTLAGGTLETTVDATLSLPTSTSGAVVINAPSTLSVPTGVTLTMGRVNSTATSAANVVTKTGAGTLRLNGSGTISAVTGGYRAEQGTIFFNTAANGGAGVGPLLLAGGDALFSKAALSDGSYSGYSLTGLQLLADGTVTLDPHPDTVSGANTLSFTSLAAGTHTLTVAKGPNARSGADTASYADPALILNSATLSGTTTLDVGANTSVTLLAATGADAGLVKTGSGRLVLGSGATAHTYTGPTTISAGTLALSGAHASALTLASGSVLQFTLNESGLPLANSTSSLTLSPGSTIRISGTPTPATTYTLLSASAITGTPVLAAPVEGFTVAVEGSSLVLKPAATGGDTTPPVITLNGSASVALSWGSGYTDAGATATDNVDASVSVQLSGTVNPAKPGIYTLTYTATDLAGNAATPVQRTVTVAIADANIAGADGLSPLLKYAFGATSPTATVQKPVLSSTATTLSLTAVIRTDDPALAVVGQAVTDLAGTWGTGGTVTTTLAADQTALPSGCVRQVFSVELAGAPRKFLRLRATLAE